MDPTPSLQIREADGSREEVQPSSTIAPYYTALNGVNQPLNMLFKDVLWWTLGIAALIVLTIRILEILWAKLRQVSAMTQPRDKQGYWKVSQWSWMPALKKHITYAPLLRKRHNREFRLSSAVNVGTLPSRLHSLLLFLFVSSNIAYIFIIDWSVGNKYAACAELRGRSGTLAVVNMIPLIIMAGRNNPLISMLKISFDTYNLLHRWMGRIIVVEVVVHTIAWAIPAVAHKGWQATLDKLFKSIFIGSGSIGTMAMILLLLLSVSPLRHAFYETFLNLHILLALVAVACTWIHCASANVPPLSWAAAVAALWAADRAARVLRLASLNWSRRGVTEAFCEAMPGETTRVTLRLPRYVKIDAGTHAYLRFWGVRAWESHPFSIAWVEHQAAQALPTSEKDNFSLNAPDRDLMTTSVSFLIGAHTGVTRALYERACQSPKGIRLRAAMEGPYAGHHNLDSYGHVVLWAGSTGITHQISHVRHLLEGYNEGSVAARRITLFWIVRTYETLEWVRPYMDTILRIPNRRDILRVHIFVTRPQNPRDILQASTSVKMFPGRPNIPMLLGKEVQDQIGAMSVSVCGPGGLADDVRGAVRQVQGENVVDFIEESFTW